MDIHVRRVAKDRGRRDSTMGTGFFRCSASLRIGAIMSVGAKQVASVEAANHATFYLCLSRSSLNKWNRNLWQEDDRVGKFNNSNATHLLTP